MPFSLQDNQVITNYHYVEDPRDDRRGIFPCSAAEFDRQIAFLSAHYRCVSVPELFDNAVKGSEEKLCAITFDDGLQDQLKYAVPMLKKYAVPATFFIITQTLEGKIPSAHKLHMIACRMPMTEIRSAWNECIADFYPERKDTHTIPADRALSDKRRHDDMTTANVKEMLNNIAPRDMADAFLSRMFIKLGIGEQELCRELFMDAGDLRSLQDQGHSIETHTHHHYSLDREAEDVLREDFLASHAVLKEITGRNTMVMAYPYGRPPADMTLLGDAGIRYGVSVEGRALARTEHPLLIPRFDTNDIKRYLDAAA